MCVGSVNLASPFRPFTTVEGVFRGDLRARQFIIEKKILKVLCESIRKANLRRFHARACYTGFHIKFRDSEEMSEILIPLTHFLDSYLAWEIILLARKSNYNPIGISKCSHLA